MGRGRVAMALAALWAAPVLCHAAPACAWRPGEVLTLDGTVASGGLTGKVTRRVEQASGRSVEAVDLGVAASATGYDGREAWSQDVTGGVHDLDSGFARALAVTMAWLDGHAGCPPPDAAWAVRAPDASEGGRAFGVWRGSPPGGAPIELWYDALTGRLDRAALQQTESRLIRRYGDWRDVGGGRMAAFSRRDEYPEDEDTNVFAFTRAQVKARAAAADFARPPPPHDARILAASGVAVAPYEDDHRTRIYVQAFLNGTGPWLFEIDNGGHFIVTEETAKAAGLMAAGSFSSTGAGTAVAHQGFARVKTFRIGAAEIDGMPVRVRALNAQANDRRPGPPRAGIIGLELFERFVVGIDRRHRTLSLRLPGAPYPTPPGTAAPLVFAEDAPLIAGRYGGAAGDFMLDTGNTGPTIIEDFWAAKAGLTGPLSAGVAVGDAKVSRGDVAFGPFDLPGETVSYYGPVERGSEYTRAVAGIYGEPLMSRFDAVYDYSRKTVWLDPLPEVGVLPFNRAGVSLAKDAAGAFEVRAVIAGSPAAEAGLAKGDTIAAIDGRVAASLSRADAMALFQRPVGTAVELAVGGGRTVRLTLEDLLP